MTQLIHEPLIAPFVPASVSRPRTGIVFVPCEICRAPVDLAVVAETHGAQVCETHRAPDFPPFA
jgi:hypothetical protein